jgi:hypothetical protein
MLIHVVSHKSFVFLAFVANITRYLLTCNDSPVILLNARGQLNRWDTERGDGRVAAKVGAGNPIIIELVVAFTTVNYTIITRTR